MTACVVVDPPYSDNCGLLNQQGYQYGQTARGVSSPLPMRLATAEIALSPTAARGGVRPRGELPSTVDTGFKNQPMGVRFGGGR